MGHHLSIDKYTSTLDDILAISPATFKRVNIDKEVSPRITQHLKIWKFYKTDSGQIKSKPVSLHNLEQTGFMFSSTEAYLVLLVYRSNTKEKVDVVSFPHSLWGLVESADNLTPRGLANSLNSDSDASSVNSLDSFLLSKRENKEYNTNREYKYMLFVWNGKEANALLKASALSRGFELDSLLNKAGDALLSFLFNGGVIKGTKFQKGRVLVFDHGSSEKEDDGNNENPNEPDSERVIKTFETVYLFQWLVPETYLQKFKNNNGEKLSAIKQQIVDEDNDLQEIKLDDNSRYLKRFKWIDSSNFGTKPKTAKVSRVETEVKEEISASPLMKLSLPSNIPMLNIPSISNNEPSNRQSKLEVSPQERDNPVPPMKGFAIDLNQVSRMKDLDYYDSKEDSPNPMAPMGMGLDLTKAKAIQNELLNQTDQAKKTMFSLNLPGSKQPESKIPSLGLPMRSVSNANEGEELDFNDDEFEQSTGPQLQINIKNIAKLKDDLEIKQEEDTYEPPQHRRGGAQPDEIDEEINESPDEENPDYMMKNTSVAEIRNNKFKMVCSEIIPSFLYLGSDFLAKDKDILMQNKI